MLDRSNNRDYTMSKILLGHTSFVGPLAWVSPKEEFPEGCIISGGMDTLVFVWNLATGEKVQTLKGHQLQVTGITLDDSEIVSSSVDWLVTCFLLWYYCMMIVWSGTCFQPGIILALGGMGFNIHAAICIIFRITIFVTFVYSFSDEIVS